MKEYIIAVWEREIGRLHDEFEKCSPHSGIFVTPVQEWYIAGVGVSGGTTPPATKREAINGQLMVARAQLRAAQEL